MENQEQNQNLNVALSQNNEEANNNVVTEAATGVDAGSDTGAKSQAGGSEQKVVKRGRGRPRKYQVDGNQVAPALVPLVGHVAIQPYGNGSDVKRGRGRPRGSGKLQILAAIGGCVAETAGGNLTPHVLNVNPGEDLMSRILTFFQKGPRAVVVLSCNGIVSSVTLRQPCASNTFLRYEGRFEILSLTGSSTYIGSNGGAQRKFGMLTILLAKTDGRVFGGGLENSLIAATSIQLILGTFKQSISNKVKRRFSSMTQSAPNMQAGEDSERENLKVPKLTLQGEPSCTSPSTTLGLQTTTNGVAGDGVTPETVNEVSVNVTPAEDDENVHSDPVGGIDLEPITDQRTSPDADNTNDINLSPQK